VPADTDDATETAETATHAVTLVWSDDRRETLDVEERETVLDAAERAGVGLPFGCLTGACGTCTGQVVEGRVEHARPPRALKDRHREAGYALLCVARPRSDCLVRVGSAVAGELVANPWK
jgi:ferredoxin